MVVIDNIKKLMRLRGDSIRDLAERSNIHKSTIGNLLSGRHKISVEAADAIARAYGLEGWHLLMPNLSDDLIQSPTISRLVQSYVAADDKGREHICHVAEREAAYSQNKPEKDTG